MLCDLLWEIRGLKQNAEELASLIEVLRSKVKQDADEEKRSRKEREMTGRSPILPRSLPWPVKGKVVMRFGRQEQGSMPPCGTRGSMRPVDGGEVDVAGSPAGGDDTCGRAESSRGPVQVKHQHALLAAQLGTNDDS